MLKYICLEASQPASQPAIVYIYVASFPRCEMIKDFPRRYLEMHRFQENLYIKVKSSPYVDYLAWNLYQTYRRQTLFAKITSF